MFCTGYDVLLQLSDALLPHVIEPLLVRLAVGDIHVGRLALDWAPVHHVERRVDLIQGLAHGLEGIVVFEVSADNDETTQRAGSLIVVARV